MEIKPSDASDITEKDWYEAADPAEGEFFTLTLKFLKHIHPAKYTRKRRLSSEIHADRVAKLDLIHKSTPHYIQARDLFLRAVSEIGSGREGHLMAIYGASHSGKTHILNRLHTHKDLQIDHTPEGFVLPLVYLTAPSATTTKSLGIQILSTLNKISTANGGESFDDFSDLKRPPDNNTIWNKVLRMLQSFQTDFLIIDEIHNVLNGPTAKDNSKATAMAIKNLLNNRAWPVNLVISGIRNRTKHWIDSHSELVSRVRRVEITPIPRSESGYEEIRAFVKSIEGQLDLRDKSNLDTEEMSERFWLATEGHRGKIARLIFDATAEAYAASATGLSAKGLAAMLADNTNVLHENNPFNLGVSLEKLKPPKWPGDDDDRTSLRGKRTPSEHK